MRKQVLEWLRRVSCHYTVQEQPLKTITHGVCFDTGHEWDTSITDLNKDNNMVCYTVYITVHVIIIK